MFKTFIIQQLKIFQRNKFFTFLNLFGISITIMIIMLAEIKIENQIWPGGAEVNSEKTLTINSQIIQNSELLKKGGISLIVYDEYIKSMKSPEEIAFHSTSIWSSFQNDKVEEYNVRFTNDGYWKIFQFDFIEGRSFSKEEIKNGENLIVISKMIKQRFFGNKKAINQQLEINGNTYKIIGVVKDISITNSNAFSHVWIPYTTRPVLDNNLDETGSYKVQFMAKNKSDFDAIKNEIRSIERKINLKLTDLTCELTGPYTSMEIYFRKYTDRSEYKGELYNIISLISKAMLILLLPAINLISLNLTRTQERAAEIGVRKAFGASRKRLMHQIIYENIFLTLIGGLIGLCLAYIIGSLFKESLFMEQYNNSTGLVKFQLNFMTFSICLFASLILSILSGTIPARQISKLHPADVLKGGEL